MTSRWKQAVWDLLHIFSVRSVTARVALSAGLLGLAAHPESGAEARPRVPVIPVLTPETTVRKFNGRYILKRSANAFFIHLAGHRSHSSHSSHSSHRSHSSHSSGSHYSGTHYSSSAPAPSPSPRPAEPPFPPQERAKPIPQGLKALRSNILLEDDFESKFLPKDKWQVGILATAKSSFDPAVWTDRSKGVLTLTPLRSVEGEHFSGYVSQQAFDLQNVRGSVELRQVASGDATTLFALAQDDANWVGFRISGGELSFETHSRGEVSGQQTAYDAERHRFLRLRKSDLTSGVVWETSADGKRWAAEHLQDIPFATSTLRLVLSAGTTRSVKVPGQVIFDNVVVEQKP